MSAIGNLPPGTSDYHINRGWRTGEPKQVEACDLCHEVLPEDDLSQCPQCKRCVCDLCLTAADICVECATKRRRKA